MKYFLKLGFLILIPIVLVTAACNYNLLSYGISQGIGQISVVYKAKPIDKVLKDPAFPDSLKNRLRLVEKIKKFAIDSLGLKNSKNYTTFYDQKGKPILFVVTACKPFSFEPKIWKFPFVGEVPYKGFFKLESAKKEAKKVKEEGYEVDLGTVGGWSTLGFFKDPILSNMLYRNEGDIAELIIHELTHSTLYVNDSSDFNENLANFIGVEGAVRFMNYAFGNNSDELKEYIEENEDEKTFSNYALHGKNCLDSLYKTFTSITPIEQKKKLKTQLIDRFKTNIDTLQFHEKHHYQRRINREELNNPFFMQYVRYEKKQADFSKLLKENYAGNLRQFLVDMKKKYGK